MTDRKPYRHCFPLSERDVQELLHQRGIIVVNGRPRGRHSSTKPSTSRISSSRRFSRKNCATENPAGVPGGFWMRYAARSVARNTGCSWPERTRLSKPGRWRAVDESGAVLDVLLQARRDAYAAQTFFEQLLITFDVPDVIHTDKLWGYGAALRALPVSHAVEWSTSKSLPLCIATT